jgi:2-iminobutanoate/2-iminopropanoate deaminase
MTQKHAAHLFAVFATSLLTSGCGTSGFGLPWYKQGPGDNAAPEVKREAEAERARSAAATAPAAPARAMQVSPDLVGQAPAMPRRDAAPPLNPTGEPITAAAGYTQATRHGDLLFISGQIAIDLKTNQFRGDGSAEEQTRVIMENIRVVLESHRMSIANLVSVTVYLRSLNDIRPMSIAYDSFVKGTPPARSIVEVAALPRNALVEISAIAGR